MTCVSFAAPSGSPLFSAATPASWDPPRPGREMGDAADRDVVCGVCLNHCYYGNTGSSLSMYVWEDFKNAGVVPCNRREWFNNTTGRRVTFAAHGCTYTVKCYKGDRKSAMYGSGWRKFYADNKLGKGQLVYFFLDEPSPRATICYIQYNNGSEDEETTEVNDEESIEEDDEGSEGDDDEDDDDGDVPHNIDEVIVRTRGLELTAIEETQLQSLVPLDNSFVGLPFVHRFTRTDVLAGMMKIPKIVAAAAPFEEQGIVGVCLDSGNFRRIPYHTSDDGRIVLGCKKRKEFAASRQLNVNMAVLVGFKNSSREDVDALVIMRKLG